MDEVLQSSLNKSKLIQVNACRLYLHIIYLSDIIEPDGKMLIQCSTLANVHHTRRRPHSLGHINPSHLTQRGRHGTKLYKLF